MENGMLLMRRFVCGSARETWEFLLPGGSIPVNRRTVEVPIRNAFKGSVSDGQ